MWAQNCEHTSKGCDCNGRSVWDLGAQKLAAGRSGCFYDMPCPVFWRASPSLECMQAAGVGITWDASRVYRQVAAEPGGSRGQGAGSDSPQKRNPPQGVCEIPRHLGRPDCHFRIEQHPGGVCRPCSSCLFTCCGWLSICATPVPCIFRCMVRVASGLWWGVIYYGH